MTQAFRSSLPRFQAFSARAVPQLSKHAAVDIFRQQAFVPRKPHVLPQSFLHMPAVRLWFDSETKSISSYLLEKVGDKLVTVELRERGNTGYGTRVEMPFRFFVDNFCSSAPRPPSFGRDARPLAYLAQCDLLSLVPELTDDVERRPIYIDASPDGSLYNHSVWLGQETHTPLHRDPNDNIFAQILGRKRVRLYPPDCASWLQIDSSLPFLNTSTIGDVWEDDWPSKERLAEATLDTVLGVGDGLFIPRGWWHSLRSEGHDLTASINWWFR